MRGNKCAPIFFSLSMKQKIEFCFSLTKPKQTKRKKRRKNLTPKKCWTSILKKESQVVNRVFRNESVVFQQESLQFKVSFFNKKAYSLSLTKLSRKKIFLPLCTKKKIKCWQHNLTLRHTQRKEPKNKTHDSLFSLFQIKQNSPKNWLDKWWPNHRTKLLVGSAWQNAYPKQKNNILVRIMY